MPLALGSQIGPYEIVSLIGAGGMGEVYRARDTRLGRDVAIKVLPEAFAADPDRVRRFEQEARAIAALNHPHICQIHDVGPGYLVLEYVEGTPLYGPLGVEEVVRLAVQIVTALEAAHRHGILHRDLKPGNILVTRNQGASYPPIAKLLDFGLAKSLVSACGCHAHRRGHDRGHGGVHVAGADAGKVGRCALGRLQPRCGALRADLWPASVSRRHERRSHERRAA